MAKRAHEHSAKIKKREGRKEGTKERRTRAQRYQLPLRRLKTEVNRKETGYQHRKSWPLVGLPLSLDFCAFAFLLFIFFVNLYPFKLGTFSCGETGTPNEQLQVPRACYLTRPGRHFTFFPRPGEGIAVMSLLKKSKNANVFRVRGEANVTGAGGTLSGLNSKGPGKRYHNKVTQMETRVPSCSWTVCTKIALTLRPLLSFKLS